MLKIYWSITMPDKIIKRPLVYINNVHLKGFKSIENLTIDFQKGLNILIGRNGAGKSNFMEFMYNAVATRPNSKVPYNYIKIEFISDDNHLFTIEFEKILQNSNFQKDDIDDRIEILERFAVDNKIVFDSSKNDAKREFVFNNKKIIYRGVLRSVFHRLGYQYSYPLFIKYNLPSNLYCLELPGIIKIETEASNGFWEYPDTLDFLANVLFDFEMSFDEENENIKKFITKSNIRKHLKIQDEVQDNLKLYSTIEDTRFSNSINLYKDDKTIIIDNIKIEFKINGNWLPWSQLSDGTKRLFYIIAEITISRGLILIEEPELGIHPHQFNLLMDFLKDQSQNKQIIISTHSPKALDHLAQNELSNILITYYDLNKGTQIRHLTEKEIGKAKKYMKEVGFFSDYWMLSDLE